MCKQQDILQKAFEEYIDLEQQLFNWLEDVEKLDIERQSWYKESVENNVSATSNLKEPIMSDGNSNSNTDKSETLKDKANKACESTKGFFSNLWDNHGKKIMLVTGIALGVAGTIGYDKAKEMNSSDAPPAM